MASAGRLPRKNPGISTYFNRYAITPPLHLEAVGLTLSLHTFEEEGDMFRRSLGIVAGLLLCASAWAQNSASITGTVRDATGAIVTGADVLVTSPDKGVSLKTTTNADG